MPKLIVSISVYHFFISKIEALHAQRHCRKIISVLLQYDSKPGSPKNAEFPNY